MRLETYVSPARTLVLRDIQDRDALLEALARAGAEAVDGVEVEALFSNLREREESGPTCTPEGVGFPHAMLEQSIETVVIAAKLMPAVAMGSPEQPPVDLVFCMLGGKQKPWEHVRLLARLARIAGCGAVPDCLGSEHAGSPGDVVPGYRDVGGDGDREQGHGGDSPRGDADLFGSGRAATRADGEPDRALGDE